jgi:thiamine pyrophosphokinase
VEVVLLPTAKDETDTEAALRLVVERGAEDITVFGTLGGPRLDHLVGNILLLGSPWLAGVRVRMVDDRHEALLVKGDCTFVGERGDTVSLLPLTSEVDAVRTEGLLYPLNGEALMQAATRGISNMMIGTEARVTHGNGVLLLIHYRGR